MKAKFLALAAMVLGLASCQTDPQDLDVTTGGEQEVMLTVSLPEVTRANSAQGFDLTTLGTNYDIRYILEIYRVENNVVLYDNCQHFVDTSDGTSMVFPVRLAPGYDYRIVAWADIVEEGSEADRYYYTEEGLDNVVIKDNGTVNWNAMDETRDAYTATKLIEDFNSSSNLDMELTRPFAKLRVVATDIDDIRNVGLEPTTATVEYSQNMYVKYNAVENKCIADGAKMKKHEYTYATTASKYEDDDNDGELTLFTDYIFVPSTGTAKFNFVVKDANGNEIKTNNFNTDIFVESNKLTTIKGDVLTTGGNVTIKVENELGVKETYTYVDNAEDLQQMINNAPENENTNITLGGDIDLNDLLGAGILSTRAAEPTYGLLIPAGKELTLDLNGFTISQSKTQTTAYSMIENRGTLTIKDSSANKTGKFSYADNGQGGEYVSNTIHNSGVLTIDGGTIENSSSATVASNGYPHPIDNSGTLVINGGTFTNNANYSSMRIWCTTDDDTIVTIDGGTFNGSIDFQTPSASANKGTLTIKGGTFIADTYTKCAVRLLGFGADVDEMNGYILGGHFDGAIALRNWSGSELNSKVFNITGGTFTTAAKEATSEDLLANGYVFVEGENGTYTVENVGHYTDAEGNYYITNAKGLAWVSENVNTMEFYVSSSANIFDNKTVYLANDIDLGGAEWRPIGDYAFSRTSFNGVFDGQGYTVSNFKVTEPVRWTEKVTEASYGFFGNVKGTIKNLTIKNATVNPEGGRYSAALVGRLHDGGCIENCHVENSSVTILHWQVGGLVGQNNNGNISNCSVVGSTITGKAAVGAIVGMDMKAGEHTIKNCRVANATLVQNESFGASYDASYGLAVGLVNASGIVLNIDNVVAEKNTIKGVADNTLVGDIETGATVTINGVSIATTAEQLAIAIKAGGECALGADIAMTAAIYQNVDVTIDGNGHTISQAEGTTNEFALFDSVTGKITLKNVKFAGIKGGAVLRTIGAEATLDNVTVESAETTQQQGLLRLIGKSTIKNSTFKNNTCSMVITLNYDGANNDPQVVENCVFEGNTCNGTAALYYVKGASATIKGNKFIGNTVNCETNGATVYMGFTENNVVTNNLFQNNTVNEAGTSSRVAGGIFFGYETVFTGNAFVGNNVTGENAKGNDVCVSTYYTSIDLSGNYWGGNAPVEDTNYFVQHKSDERVVTINNYLTVNPIN